MIVLIWKLFGPGEMKKKKGLTSFCICLCVCTCVHPINDGTEQMISKAHSIPKMVWFWKYLSDFLEECCLK